MKLGLSLFAWLSCADRSRFRCSWAIARSCAGRLARLVSMLSCGILSGEGRTAGAGGRDADDAVGQARLGGRAGQGEERGHQGIPDC